MEQNKCLNNLETCDAICCKTWPVAIPIDYEENKDLYNQRGCKVSKSIIDNEEVLVLLVPSRCPNLGEDNKCKIWDTDKLPEQCRKSYREDKSLIMPKECVYNED
jgi:hypothetical protein